VRLNSRLQPKNFQLQFHLHHILHAYRAHAGHIQTYLAERYTHLGPLTVRKIKILFDAANPSRTKDNCFEVPETYAVQGEFTTLPVSAISVCLLYTPQRNDPNPTLVCTQISSLPMHPPSCLHSVPLTREPSASGTLHTLWAGNILTSG
jgi:hypothetical protein